MEQLIRDLNDPRNQSLPGNISHIQRQIQHLQREPSAWQTGLDFLEHPDAILRFYGALTLTVKVNADWTQDIGKDESSQEHLLQRIISSYVNLTGSRDESFVLLKICTTLAAIFRKPSCNWSLAIRHISACILQGQFIDESMILDNTSILEDAHVATFFQLRSMVWFAASLVEDTLGVSPNSETTIIEHHIARNAPDAWGLIELCLITYLQHRSDLSLPPVYGQLSFTPHLSSDESLQLAKIVIPIIPLWARHIRMGWDTEDEYYADTLEISTRCLQIVIRCVHLEEISVLSIQTLTAIQQYSSKLLSSVESGFFKQIVSSRQARGWIETLSHGDFDVDALSYVDFLESVLSQADIASKHDAYFAARDVVFETVQKLLRCNGVAMVEDTVCQTALEIITQIVENYADQRGEAYDDTVMKMFTANACSACLTKIEIPEEELYTKTSTWDADERTRFQDFRYDTQDFLQASFTTLGIDLVEAIVRTLIRPDQQLAWPTFEANIYALTAFSDIVTSDEDVFDNMLSAVLSTAKWQTVMQPPPGIAVPDRVTRTCIKFIAENSSYLERHSENLVTSLNFLFISLQVPSYTNAASRAIYTLCDSQRSALVDALPHFISSLALVDNLRGPDRQRIFGAVATVIEALPNEQSKVQPLTQILEMISAMCDSWRAASLDDETTVVIATDLMNTLAFIGRGIRTPHETPIDLEEDEKKEMSFWTSGSGSSVQQKSLHLYSAITGHVGSRADSAFIDAACDFVKSGQPEEHPSPFKFVPSVSIQLVRQLVVVGNPNIDATMSCATSLLASIQQNELDKSDFAQLLYSVVQGQQQVLNLKRTSTQEVETSFASSTLDFMARTLPKWHKSWFSMPDYQSTSEIAIQLGLALLNEADTLPRRSAASFFAALFDISDPNLHSMPSIEATDPASTRVRTTIQSHAPQVVALLLRLVSGECARSEIEALTEPLKKMMQRQLALAKRILKEAIRPEAGVLTEKALAATTMEERERFVAQVESLRGARKTGELVKEWWVKCRGSGFGYVA